LRYISTRGEADALAFEDVLLAGLASDGGLYTPKHYPRLPPEAIRDLAGLPYAAASARLLAPFIGDAAVEAELPAATQAAYAGFRHPAVAPLVQIGDNLFVLELFHGPTLAFKDLAMQLLGRLMNNALERRNLRATIVGATSGDTGAAAIEAFRGLDRVDVFILFPDGRVSDVQRRQMTTVAADNIHAIALDGTFDDAQAILKKLFRDPAFRRRTGLAGVNSINWARVMAQTVYYFTSAVALGAPSRDISFAVPTGNFGDVLAGYVARRMGLSVGRLHVATNSNDILARALATGRYEPRGVTPTQSPSMDIQVSSNFERLLFDTLKRDAGALRGLFESFDQSGGFDIPAPALAAICAEFDALKADEDETTQEIARVWRDCGYAIDPHTATGVHAARRALAKDPATPVVALATAHPAKFPQAMTQAIGAATPLPPHMERIMSAPEHFTVLANDASVIASFIDSHARATRG